jgi:hypothetical protein
MKSSKLTVIMVLITVIALLGLLAGCLHAQPGQGQGQGQGQGRGGPGSRGGGMGAMNYLDRAWTVINFGLECTPEQIEKLRPAFANGYAVRTDAMNKIAATEDKRAAFQEAMPVLQQMQTSLEAQVKLVLTPEQLTKLQTLMAAGQGRPGGNRGGQGGGQAGPPPAQN